MYYLANDIATDPQMIPWRENALRLGYKSSMSFPTKVFGKTIGAFNLYSDEEFFFDEAEIKLLDELAMDISFAIEFNENEAKRKIAEEELIIANKELVFQNREKEKRADELIIANKELVFQNEEKEKRAAELIIAKEKAEESNRLKSGFISAMSHEIRTPLNIILGYNDLIEDMYCDPANEEILSYFNAITNNGNRLIDTITKILDISRIEAGEFPISLQPLPIKEIIDRTYYSMKILAEKKKLRLVFNPPAENISVLADAYCLENSLINLLNNAIKYSEKGTVEISLKKEDKFAVCKIKDEGIGMSESYQKHLFQTFSQEKVGISRPYEGVGLGLALTKKYVERMQAGIEIQSKEGLGTTVTLKLPLAK